MAHESNVTTDDVFAYKDTDGNWWAVPMWHRNWLHTATGRRLHHVADALDVSNGDGTRFNGAPACHTTHRAWIVPGPMSRLAMLRCAGCCKAMGIAAGKGTPQNEASRDKRHAKNKTTTK